MKKLLLILSAITILSSCEYSTNGKGAVVTPRIKAIERTGIWSRYFYIISVDGVEYLSSTDGGHLDMILWNTIHVDTENALLELFKLTFALYADEFE